ERTSFHELVHLVHEVEAGERTREAQWAVVQPEAAGLERAVHGRCCDAEIGRDGIDEPGSHDCVERTGRNGRSQSVRESELEAFRSNDGGAQALADGDELVRMRCKGEFVKLELLASQESRG